MRCFRRSRSPVIQVVTLPDEERAHAIGKHYENERTHFFAELLIDRVQNPPACAMLVAAILESLRAY